MYAEVTAAAAAGADAAEAAAATQPPVQVLGAAEWMPLAQIFKWATPHAMPVQREPRQVVRDVSGPRPLAAVPPDYAHAASMQEGVRAENAFRVAMAALGWRTRNLGAAMNRQVDMAWHTDLLLRRPRRAGDDDDGGPYLLHYMERYGLGGGGYGRDVAIVRAPMPRDAAAADAVLPPLPLPPNPLAPLRATDGTLVYDHLWVDVKAMRRVARCSTLQSTYVPLELHDRGFLKGRADVIAYEVYNGAKAAKAVREDTAAAIEGFGNGDHGENPAPTSIFVLLRRAELLAHALATTDMAALPVESSSEALGRVYSRAGHKGVEQFAWARLDAAYAAAGCGILILLPPDATI